MTLQEQNIYMTFVVNALRGGSPIATDAFLRDNLKIIKRVAKELYKNISIKPIYRGVILDEKNKSFLNPHPGFTYISFSEDKSVAEHFADTSSEGFGTFLSLGDYGYIITLEPKDNYDLLFHYSLLDTERINFLKVFTPEDIDFYKKQKEVMILQPFKKLPLQKYLPVKKNPSDMTVFLENAEELESVEDIEKQVMESDVPTKALLFYSMSNELIKQLRKMSDYGFIFPTEERLKNSVLNAQFLLRLSLHVLDRKNLSISLDVLEEYSRSKGFYDSRNEISEGLKRDIAFLVCYILGATKTKYARIEIINIIKGVNKGVEISQGDYKLVKAYLSKNFNKALKATSGWIDWLNKRKETHLEKFKKRPHAYGTYEDVNKETNDDIDNDSENEE